MFIEDLKHSKIDKTEEEEEENGYLCEEQSICHVRSTNWSIKSWTFPLALMDNLCFGGGQNALCAKQLEGLLDGFPCAV